MSIDFYSLQPSNEVTASCHILDINGNIFMLDCGGMQGAEFARLYNNEFYFDGWDKLQGVFLSHAHYDHCGNLPKLIKDGYKGKIWSTPATRDLSSIIMLDSAKIQKYEKPAPAYEEHDVVETINHFRCHAYGKEKKINDFLTSTFYNAGHILGSALIDFKVEHRGLFNKLLRKEPTHILFTGDLGRNSNPITNPPDVDIPAPDYIIMESTYGNRTHGSVSASNEDMIQVINETLEKRGKVIIPAFAIERAQELIYHIKLFMQEKRIPRVPVYVDSPMASNATGVFNIHPECFNGTIVENFISKGKNPFSVRTLRCITDYEESLKVAKSKEPAIIIAASGMCEAGRILNHLQYGIEQERNTILIVGYMGEGTLGRKILEREPVVEINGDEYKLKARVHSISGYSSHADVNEIQQWLRCVDTSKLKKIYIVHGDKDARIGLSEVLNNLGFDTEIVKQNTVYRLS